LLLNKALLETPFHNKETEALYALMLFNAARLESRFSPTGELMDLENQDRSLWNRDLILMVQDFLNRSQDDAVSTYHLEAAIACVHCLSESFEATDWKLIAGLYARLLYIQPNPFVELNYAIALYYAGDKEDSFKILRNCKATLFLIIFNS
jgi:RNA polymerase sigma-70 factor (ECF subfamily)